MSQIFRNNFVKYAVFGASAIILSEIGFQFFRWWMKRCADVRALEANREIADVIWINELTENCTETKFNRKSKYHNDDKCKNMFCCARNIGKVIAHIDNAKYSIDLSMYIFTSYDLSHALQRALKRGLQIRIISDKEMVYSSSSQITDLTKAGIPVRYPNAINMLMHHKFCILDGPVRSRAVAKQQKKPYGDTKNIVFSGSLNWTLQGFNSNFENMIISSNSKLVGKFEEEFQRMWETLDTLDVTG